VIIVVQFYFIIVTLSLELLLHRLMCINYQALLLGSFVLLKKQLKCSYAKRA